MKIKEGRRTSHSYWSRTHGPRRTTHGTSGEHPWWRGDSRRSLLPPAGCREEVFWCSRSDRGRVRSMGTDPWSKKNYSRDIRGASMVERRLPEVNPPSGRVPGRGLLVLPILEARGGGTEASSRNRVPLLEFSRDGG